MRTFVGIGKGSGTAAIEEATKGLTAPRAIIFSSPYERIQETAAYLTEKYKGVPMIGNIGIKLVNGTVGTEMISVTAFFEDVKVQAGVIANLDTCPIASIAQLESAVSAVSPGREDTVCLEFCTNDEEKLVTTLYSIFHKKGISLVGGTAYEDGDGKKSVVACNGQIYENACAYMLIKNTTGKVKVYKENIYKKKSDITHFATKVDVKTKGLLELDGKPAANVYSQEIGVPKDRIIDNVFQNPIGRVVGDQVFVSSMKELGKNGELYNYKRINKNDCIYFMELGDYKKIEEEHRKHISSEFKHISFVFSVDCYYRYALYTGEHFTADYAKGMASLGNHMGVVCGGEQFNNQHVNQTMLCAVFE